ncbi:hypothetical protein ACG0Z6_04990 [Roseateles sp. BYS180W]|uniref:Uncharacterized protein n=1 Tax=Roseateles rivi TaxID=3299028 RepID=A0ABW7FTK6_9BURK
MKLNLRQPMAISLFFVIAAGAAYAEFDAKSCYERCIAERVSCGELTESECNEKEAALSKREIEALRKEEVRICRKICKIKS